MVAKHFTVSSAALPHIRRQYTICQTMQVDILRALYKLADDILHSDESGHRNVKFNESLLDRGSHDTNEISFTLKNYERPNGVATQIFDVPLQGFKSSIG